MATISNLQTEVLKAFQGILPTDSVRSVFVCVRLVPEVPLGTRVAPLRSDFRRDLTTHPSYWITPSDHAAIEQALTLKDSLHCRVILIGFGRSKADSSVRGVLARGIDGALQITGTNLLNTHLNTLAAVIGQIVKSPNTHAVLFGLGEVNDDTVPLAEQLSNGTGYSLTMGGSASREHPLGESLQQRRVLQHYGSHSVVGEAKSSRITLVPENSLTLRLPPISAFRAAARVPMRSVELDPVSPSCEEPDAKNSSLAAVCADTSVWGPTMRRQYVPFTEEVPVLTQLDSMGLELDQRLGQIFAIATSRAILSKQEQIDDLIIGDLEFSSGLEGEFWESVTGRSSKFSGIRDSTLIYELLLREPSYLNPILDHMPDPVTRALLQQAIERDSPSAHFVTSAADECDNAFAPTPTARVFSRAAFRARARGDGTLRWQDLLRASIDLSLALGEDVDNRPMFADWLIERLHALRGGAPPRWSWPLSHISGVRTILAEVRGGLPDREGDFQYLLTTESQGFVFRICSVLGDFVQRSPGRELRAVRAILLHGDKPYWTFRPEWIDELQEMLQSRTAREADYQSFFERHPTFFRLFGHREIYPLVFLSHAGKPDFILTNRDAQELMLLELKLPSVRLTLERKRHVRFAASVLDARAQLQTYQAWLADKGNRRLMEQFLGMHIGDVRLGVIIGRSSDFTDDVQRATLNARHSDLSVITYDDLIKYALNQSARIEKLWRPD